MSKLFSIDAARADVASTQPREPERFELDRLAFFITATDAGATYRLNDESPFDTLFAAMAAAERLLIDNPDLLSAHINLALTIRGIPYEAHLCTFGQRTGPTS